MSAGSEQPSDSTGPDGRDDPPKLSPTPAAHPADSSESQDNGSGNGRSIDGEGVLAVTNAIVRLLRAHAGRGPTKARTVVSGDLVVVHLRDCLTVAERTINGLGQRQLVASGRDVLHAAIRAEATAAVEEISGRRVIAYLSSQNTDPDHALIAFVLDGRSS